MSKKKKYKKIKERFIPLPHNLVDSEAYKQLSATATRAFIYFKRDVKNGHQTEVVLTFGQAVSGRMARWGGDCKLKH